MIPLSISFIIICLIGCSAPLQPPMVDGTMRQQVNLCDRVLELHDIQKRERIRAIVEPQSKIFTIYFSLNSTKIKAEAFELQCLNSWLSRAKRIEIRGRTDGQQASLGDENIARGRVLAVQRYLIERGVPSTIMALNYLSAGDYVADNSLRTHRRYNRRVEIEVFVE